MRRLSGFKSEYKYFNLVKQNVTYAVTFDISIRKNGERAELPHRYQQARVWHCLEAVLPITNRKTDRMWRAEGGTVIPDGSFTLNRQGFILEVNQGRDHFDAIMEKSRRYHRDREYFSQILGVDQIMVLWVSKLPGRAERMLEKFCSIGSGGMFLVAIDQDINPFNPATILGCWRSPKTGEIQPLVEESPM